MITRSTIAIPHLDDLKARLAQVRWTNELSGVGTDYGVDLGTSLASACETSHQTKIFPTL